MATTTMTALVQRVAEARRTAAGYDETVRAARAEFEAANAELFAEAKAARDAVATAEAELRALALAAYATTKSKAPVPGVTIKVGTSIVYDEADALAWAKETKLCLVPESLDARAFGKIALATKLPFVTMEEKPVAAIATDLEKALAVAEATAPQPAPPVAPEPEAAAEPIPF